MSEITCSFCDMSTEDDNVKLMIVGTSGFICDACIRNCFSFLTEQEESETRARLSEPEIF